MSPRHEPESAAHPLSAADRQAVRDVHSAPRLFVVMQLSIIAALVGFPLTMWSIFGVATGAPIKWFFWIVCPGMVAGLFTACVCGIRLNALRNRFDRPDVEQIPRATRSGAIELDVSKVQRQVRGAGRGALIAFAIGLVALLALLWLTEPTHLAPRGRIVLMFPLVCLVIAAGFLPYTWSWLRRSSRFGVRLDGDQLVVHGYLRDARFSRHALWAASPVQATPLELASDDSMTRLWPKDPGGRPVRLPITAGSWTANCETARQINAWLGVEVDFATPKRARTIEPELRDPRADQTAQ